MSARPGEDRRTRLERLAKELARAREEEAREARLIFLVVQLGDRRFLIAADDVAEIVRPVPLSPAFGAPEHILGVAAVHGRPWTIIELGLFLPLPRSAPKDAARTRWVLLRHPHMHVGFRADAVLGMRFAKPEEIEATRGEGPWRGRFRRGGEVLQVFDAEAVFA